jgi:hypothetical protein
MMTQFLYSDIKIVNPGQPALSYKIYLILYPNQVQEKNCKVKLLHPTKD